ncbi:MAG: RdgB/HAM1 family non-canonical purine NTP pyrophosphatase [Clostridia bacterium]|nr:RdgB/HAM1 family non-canonical purine NTP pyrophosphatase [Clostridia bacterium]
MDIVIASNNPGKIREYRDLLEPLGFRVFSQSEKGIDLEVEETGTTFEENALLKAGAVRERAGCPVISDDSGLEVEALGGEPGIYSARYRGLATEHERRTAILDALRDAPTRKARFVCCICLIDARGESRLFKGVWNGEIAQHEEGTNGFGYDPIFIAEEADGRTTASLPISFKETFSHRAKAVRMLTEHLRNAGLTDRS